jgi:hypothetical protein
MLVALTYNSILFRAICEMYQGARSDAIRDPRLNGLACPKPYWIIFSNLNSGITVTVKRYCPCKCSVSNVKKLVSMDYGYPSDETDDRVTGFQMTFWIKLGSSIDTFFIVFLNCVTSATSLITRSTTLISCSVVLSTMELIRYENPMSMSFSTS